MIFRKDPDAVAHGDHERLSDRSLRQLRGNVHRRIAGTDDEDTLVSHVDRIERRVVAVRMDLLAAKRARIGGVGPARIPMMAVSDK